MIVTLQTQRVRTLEQVRRVAEGNKPVDFTLADHLKVERRRSEHQRTPVAWTDSKTGPRRFCCRRRPSRSRGLAGESLPIMGERLGHKRSQTTACYAHLARESVKAAACLGMAIR